MENPISIKNSIFTLFYLRKYKFTQNFVYDDGE